MPTAGLDVHKKLVEACVLDEEGKVKLRLRFACTRENLRGFAQTHLGPHAQLALEATTNTWAIVDILRPLVGEVVVSNPLRTRAIAEAKVKSDRVDAQVLAELLCCGYLPRVWQPDEPTRLLRHLTARRAGLVAERTRIKNRIHAVLHQRLIPAPPGDLFGKKSMAWRKALELDAPGRQAIDSELRLLELCQKEIKLLDETLIKHAALDSRLKLLITLPGVDVAVAQTLLACLGDISRFRDADHAASYLGLTPSTRQSAAHCYHGPITKQGNGHARWMLIQAAQCDERDHPCSERLPMSGRDYVDLLRWSAGSLGAGDAVESPDSASSFLRRIGLEPANFVDALRCYARGFFTMVGEVHRIDAEAQRRGYRRCHGRRAAQRLYRRAAA